MRHSKLTPLRWNEFPITASWKDIVCVFDVVLTTKSLSLNVLPEGREYRHDLILRLFDNGMTDKEIAEYLNASGIETPRGRAYYPKLVWVTRKKLQKRTNRTAEETMELRGMQLFLSREYRI